MSGAGLGGRSLLEQTLRATGEMKDDEIDLADVALTLAALDRLSYDLVVDVAVVCLRPDPAATPGAAAVPPTPGGGFPCCAVNGDERLPDKFI